MRFTTGFETWARPEDVKLIAKAADVTLIERWEDIGTENISAARPVARCRETGDIYECGYCDSAFSHLAFSSNDGKWVVVCDRSPTTYGIVQILGKAKLFNKTYNMSMMRGWDPVYTTHHLPRLFQKLGSLIIDGKITAAEIKARKYILARVSLPYHWSELDD
jgi:hypothetical protein